MIKREVFKIQRPIFTNGDYEQVLIYNESQSVVFQKTVSDDEQKQIFPNDEYKTYWVCEYRDTRANKVDLATGIRKFENVIPEFFKLIEQVEEEPEW